MKTMMTSILSACLVGALSLTACGQDNRAVKNEITRASRKGFAVLELFTSEGCSSCPRADELMAKIQQETKDKPVYILAFHVDYWNRLGWKDVFSSADFSRRQEQYSSWLNSQVYTPQLVINGRAEFVGSDAQAIRKAISRELATPSMTNLTLHVRRDGEKLHVYYQGANTGKDARLLITLVQKNAQSKVERGENGGRTLSHVQIVRKLHNILLKASGEGNSIVALPQGFNSQGWEVLGILQDQDSGSIIGAAKAGPGKNVIAKR